MIKVGTRGSTLALRQADEVINQLQTAYPGIYFQAVAISTSGDGQAESPISKLGVGAFVKEIERSLLEGSIDLAVHSLKDLPTQLPDGLVLGAALRREDPRDVLVNRWSCPLSQVPTGARIGTGSPRREAQLKHLRPDLQVLPIRGNVETRINKTLGPDYDGAVLAAAGMIRLGLEDKISEFFPYNDFVPAPGQGALAVEVRQDDADILKMVSAIEPDKGRGGFAFQGPFLNKNAQNDMPLASILLTGHDVGSRRHPRRERIASLVCIDADDHAIRIPMASDANRTDLDFRDYVALYLAMPPGERAHRLLDALLGADPGPHGAIAAAPADERRLTTQYAEALRATISGLEMAGAADAAPPPGLDDVPGYDAMSVAR